MIKRFDGTNWTDIQFNRRFDGTNWVDTQFNRRFDGTNWVDVWSSEKVLYDYGNEKTEITGGWGTDILWHNGYTAGYIAKESDHLLSADLTSNYGNKGFCTRSPVNIGTYKNLNVLLNISENRSLREDDVNGNAFFISLAHKYITGSFTGRNEDFLFHNKKPVWQLGNANNVVLSASVVNAGNKYVCLIPCSHAHNSDTIVVRIYRVWLSM